MKRRLTLTIAASLVLTLVATAPANAGIRTVKKCHASGDFATCVAAKNVPRPHGLFVKVVARPRQHVTVYWDTVCSHGTGAGGKHGHFTVMAPKRRKVKMAYAAPDSCIFSADGQLASGGHLTVLLQANL